MDPSSAIVVPLALSLAAAAPAAPTPAGPRAAPALENAELTPAPRPCRALRGCRQLLTLGAVASSLGGAAIVTGAILATRPDVPIEHEPAYLRSFTPPGVTVAVLGGAVLATGVVMLIAALRRTRRR